MAAGSSSLREENSICKQENQKIFFETGIKSFAWAVRFRMVLERFLRNQLQGCRRVRGWALYNFGATVRVFRTESDEAIS